MKAFITTALAAAVAAIPLDDDDFKFMKYVSGYNKAYDTVEEYEMRKAIFLDRDAEIIEWNAKGDTAHLGHNHLSDWSKQEIKDRLLGLKSEPDMTGKEPVDLLKNSNYVANYPSSMNWCTQAGYCTPIKDQASCGSCYAFSATAVLETSYKIDNPTVTIPVLSTQQIVSCSQSYGNNGCNGGWYFYAWDYLYSTPQNTNANYPYASGTGTLPACKTSL